MVGFYATEEEAALLMKAAQAKGMTLADFLRSVVRDAPTQLPKSKKRAAKHD